MHRSTHSLRNARLLSVLLPAAYVALIPVVSARDKPAETSPERARPNFARLVQLVPDDVRVFPGVRAGFDVQGSNLYHFMQRLFR